MRMQGAWWPFQSEVELGYSGSRSLHRNEQGRADSLLAVTGVAWQHQTSVEHPAISCCKNSAPSHLIRERGGCRAPAAKGSHTRTTLQCRRMHFPGCCLDSLQCRHAESLSSSLPVWVCSPHAGPDLVRQFVEALPLSELSRLLDPGLSWHSEEDLCSHAVALQASLAGDPERKCTGPGPLGLSAWPPFLPLSGVRRVAGPWPRQARDCAALLCLL